MQGLKMDKPNRWKQSEENCNMLENLTRELFCNWFCESKKHEFKCVLFAHELQRLLRDINVYNWRIMPWSKHTALVFINNESSLSVTKPSAMFHQYIPRLIILRARIMKCTIKRNRRPGNNYSGSLLPIVAR